MQVQVLVLLRVEDDRQDPGDDLADHRGHRRPRDPHLGEAQEPEDQDRVQDDVDDSPAPLGDHRVEGPARGDQQPLKDRLGEQAEGEAQGDCEIGHPIAHDLGVVGLAPVERPHRHQSDQKKEEVTQHRQEDPVLGGAVRLLKVLFSQGTGEDRVDPDPGADPQGDHQGL